MAKNALKAAIFMVEGTKFAMFLSKICLNSAAKTANSS